MQFGNSFIALGIFSYTQKKGFFQLLSAGKYRGDFEQAWKDYRKASKKKK